MDEVITLFWDCIFVSTGKATLILLTLFSVALSTRLLGVAGYGKLSLFISVVQLFFLAGMSWTGTAMIRFGKEELVLNKKINKTFWSRSIILFPISLLIVSLVFVLRDRIFLYVGINSGLLVTLIVIYLLCLIAADYRQYLLQSVKKLKSYSIMQPFEKLLVILGLCLIMIKLLPASVSMVIIIFIIANVVTSVYIFIQIRRYLFPVIFDFSYIKKILTFSYPLILGTINTYLFYWMGVILINKFMTVKDVGIYSLAKNGAEVIEQITMSTTVITIPMVISFVCNKKEHLVERYVHRVIPYGILLVVLVMSILIAISRPLITILGGREFAGAAFPFTGLLVGYTASGISSMYTPLIINYGLIKQSVVMDTIGILANILLGYLLIPRIGINGAVIGVFATFYLWAILRMYIVRRHLKFSTFRYLSLTVPVFVAFYFFALHQSRQFFILGSVIIAAALYFIKKRFDLFNKDDLWVFDKMDMPIILKKGIRKIFQN